MWAKTAVEKYDIQDWTVQAITYETETTAVVLIERNGYEVPKYIVRDFPIKQIWEYDETLGWRIRSGF